MDPPVLGGLTAGQGRQADHSCSMRIKPRQGGVLHNVLCVCFVCPHVPCVCVVFCVCCVYVYCVLTGTFCVYCVCVPHVLCHVQCTW